MAMNSEGIDLDICEAITKLIASDAPKFDFYSTKILYFKKLRKIYELFSQRLCPKFWNQLLLNEYINEINSIGTKYNQFIYDIIQEDGENILVRKRNKINDPIIKVLSAEECFPVIIEAHIQTMHGNEILIVNKTQFQYEYPLFCIPLVLQSCNVCSKGLITECKTISTEKSLWKFTIQKRNLKKFRHFIVYSEAFTSFTLLRPIKQINIEIVGMELYKIFRTFGPPKKIMVLRNYLNFLDRTLKMLATIEPCYMVNIAICPDYLIDVNSIHSALDKWSKKNRTLEMGCHMVQWQLNTSVRVIPHPFTSGAMISGVPHNLFYGDESKSVNYTTDDVVSEQLSHVKRKSIKLEVLSEKGKVIEKEIDFDSDESDTEGDRDDKDVTCCICGKEFVMYMCWECHKYLHYECGKSVFVPTDDYIKTCELICNSCNQKKSLEMSLDT